MHPPSTQAAAPFIPEGVFCAQDYEAHAERLFAAAEFAYVAGGTGTGLAADANRRAYGAWSIIPRLLKDVTTASTRVSVGGFPLQHPILLAPVAYQNLAHPLGELETAQAARVTETTLILSTLSTCTIEDVARAGQPDRWFQLYLQPDEADTLRLIGRAEGAGYGAIVLTLDAAIQAAGHAALRAGFRLPERCRAANLDASTPATAPPLPASGSRIFQGAMRHAPTLSQVARVIERTRLPVWIKGVMHPEDVALFAPLGVAGYIVSNHGGRSLDSAPASLHMLPLVRQAVGPSVPLLFDGGIRSGADVFKAIALGADAVLVGRLQMYALRVAGALGVAHMLKLLREELETTMALAGCASTCEITPASLFVVPPSA